MSLKLNEHTAFYGGSFDPPHLGHVEAVDDLIKTFGFSRVTVLPSLGTPLKSVGTPFKDRFEMTRIAFEKIAAATVSDLEQKEDLRFTWQVLEKLTPQIKNLAFVIGTDQFESLSKWARYPDLMGMCDWIVLKRKPEASGMLTEKEARLKKAVAEYVCQGWLAPGQNEIQFNIKQMTGSAAKPERTLYIVETKARALSSTFIRQKLALGALDEVKTLVGAPVLEYVKRNKLYGT